MDTKGTRTNGTPWADNTDIFGDDLYEISDFTNGATKPIREIPRNSTTQYARSKPSIFDPFEEDMVDENEGVRYPVASRGPNMRSRGSLRVQPGGHPSFLERQKETSKHIRQVSALGFGNDLIEHVLRGDNTEDATKKTDMHKIKVTESPDTSVRSTPGNSPLKVKALSQLNTGDDIFHPSTRLISPVPSEPMVKNSLTVTKVTPPPTMSSESIVPGLYDIINSAATAKRSVDNAASLCGSNNATSLSCVKNAALPTFPTRYSEGEHVKLATVAYRPHYIINGYDNTKREKDKLVLDIYSPVQFPPL